MANNEERDKRIGTFIEAAFALGIGVTALSRSSIGRDFFSSTLKRGVHVTSEISNELSGKTLKNTWGNGLEHFKRLETITRQAVDTPLNEISTLTHRNDNLLGALKMRSQFPEYEASEISKHFNREVMPNRLREVINHVVSPKTEIDLARIDTLVDNLTHHQDQSILFRDNQNVPYFTDTFIAQTNIYFGEDKAKAVTDALAVEYANFSKRREAFNTGKGQDYFNAVLSQLDDYTTYEKFESKNSFFSNLLNSTKPATVNDVLSHQDTIRNENMFGADTDFYLSQMEELVNKDNRFGELVIDNALHFKDDSFYDYSSARYVKEGFEEGFLKGAGKIFKPLEVRVNQRKTPNLFHIAKGSYDPILQSIAEENNQSQYLDNSYTYINNKLYRFEDNTLNEVELKNPIYLAHNNNFEGKMIRSMTGNYDYSINEQGFIATALGIESQKGQKLSLKQQVKLFFTSNKQFKSTFTDVAANLSRQVHDNSATDHLQMKKRGMLYQDVFTLIGEVEADSDVVSSKTLKLLADKTSDKDIQRAYRLAALSDQELLKALDNDGFKDIAMTEGITYLMNFYHQDSVGATNKIFYHNKKKSSFANELRRELIKGAPGGKKHSTTLPSLMMLAKREKIDSADYNNLEKLSYLGYLEKKTGASHYRNSFFTEGIINSEENFLDLQALFLGDQEVSKHFRRIFSESSSKAAKNKATNELLQFQKYANVIEARKPNTYMTVQKGINPLNIIESLNRMIRGGTSWSQYVAGGDTLKDVTTQTLYPYHMLARLSHDVKRSRLNLSRHDMKSVLDISKNIFLKRALPIYVGAGVASYLSYEFENLTGVRAEHVAAQSLAKADLGMRGVTDLFKNQLKDAHYWFTLLHYWQDEEYQTKEERKEWYESGYSPVKQGKFWALGSSEFFGGRTLYYEPNFVNQSRTNWQDIGIYGSSKEKWKHSLMPSLRHPFSTIRYLMNPYWLEEKHALDRPYPVSGPMFDTSTPWGAIGNLTIGQIIKPQKRLHKDRLTNKGVDIYSIIEAQNQHIKDKARGEENVISILSSDSYEEKTLSSYGAQGDGRLSTNILQGATGSGLGRLVTRRESDTYNHANSIPLADKLLLFAASIGDKDKILDQLEGMNWAIQHKARLSYGKDSNYAKEIQGITAKGSLDLLHDSRVQEDLRHMKGTTDMLHDLAYNVRELGGLYNFLGEFIIPPKKSYAYARSSEMYNASNRFWDSGIDGADFGGIMEVARRFFPHEDRNRIRINPLKNNMPSWMPDRFKYGDPYTLIKEGEMRLPGKGFEALYKIESPLGLTVDPSAVGKSVEGIIESMIGAQSNTSAGFLNSAQTGAQQQYTQILKQAGIASSTENYIEDKKNGIKGHYDALINDPTSSTGKSITDIKTVSNDVFQNVSVAADPEHIAQVNYYLGTSGLNNGYITYINHDTNEMITHSLHFSEQLYKTSLANVREARKRVMKMLDKGFLSPYEFYDDFTRFKILADVSPGSTEYKKYKNLVFQKLRPEQQKEYDAILKRVSKQSKKHNFFNYKFTNVNVDSTSSIIESIDAKGNIKLAGQETTFSLAGLKNHEAKIRNYLQPGMRVRLEYEKNYQKSKHVSAAFYANGLNVNRQILRSGDGERNDNDSPMATRALLSKTAIMLGKPFEMLSHFPFPYVHNKLLKVNSPHESWMRENVYGSKYSSWFSPIDTLLKPALFNSFSVSQAHALLGTVAFGYNLFASDLITSGKKRLAMDAAQLLLTPGAAVGEIAERILTLNPVSASTKKGRNIGSAIALTGYALTHADNPLFSLSAGAGIGYMMGDYLKKGFGEVGAVAGLVAGTAISSMANGGFHYKQMSKTWIPGSTKKRWDIEEYFDRLEYLKYKGLYEKTASLALSKEGTNIEELLDRLDKTESGLEDEVSTLLLQRSNIQSSNLTSLKKKQLLDTISKQVNDLIYRSDEVPATPYTRLALGYKQAMESTVYALDENSSWAQILRALEPYEREYFMEFAKETDPSERKKILKSLPPYKQKILQNLWGIKAKKQKSNARYFKTNHLPNFAWKGWNADENLDGYKMRTIENEGMQLSDFGYYESEKDKPNYMYSHAIPYDSNSMPVLLQANLLSIMNGLGLSNADVSILPSQSSNIEIVSNFVTQSKQKISQGLEALQWVLL